MQKQRIVVTGGAGFVGSNLVKMLRENTDNEIIVIDDLFSGSIENLKGLDVEFVEGSVLNSDLLNKYITKDAMIYHLAARNIIASAVDPRKDMETNIQGTFNVLEVAKNNFAKRVLYTSTSSIYGNPKYLPINEEDSVSFLNFYSVSKYAGEAYAKVFYEAYNLPITVVRYSNVYGYNQRSSNPYSGVIGKFIDSALKNSMLNIHGDGEQTRDFTFVEDACRATILAAQSYKAIGEAYNIGTGIETSINQLASIIINLTDSKSDVQSIEKRDIDNLRRRVMNIEKMRYQLKFSPAYTLNKGLQKTIEWQLEQNK
ncbi:NAD-dependent epimerase/dehydratase family protein [Metasolibacillus sp.]|uniref:NAD-dependent epimerase/dehydratase family protein n=1 Tax=Metasolibacillus sp. TaxID=2703680 RepID=UPI0025CEC31C|nr:NAD-dependent epimerase/dehydratase family protein [Metasolibacillus sp.]MCT6925663.1 NAD-dependent epimerase/dehydratase family protein [Metasolibacillus sp.]MCT6940983.1 NAD-dependent epimerase/dehydratase family protein [Metasolibacillus sp.]